MTGKKKMSRKKVYRYSEAFKHQVVSEIENGDINQSEARIKYGIKGSETINKWIRKMGKNELLCRIVKIQTPNEVEQLKLLQKRISELEKALAQTQLECLQSESYLLLACEQLGINIDSFKKKSNAKPPDGCKTKRHT